MGRDRSWAQPADSEQETSSGSASSSCRPARPFSPLPSLLSLPLPSPARPSPAAGGTQAGRCRERGGPRATPLCAAADVEPGGLEQRDERHSTAPAGWVLLGFFWYFRVRNQTFRQANKKTRVGKSNRFTPFPRLLPPQAESGQEGAGRTRTHPAPDSDHHSSRGNFWDYVSISPGWEFIPSGVKVPWGGRGSPRGHRRSLLARCFLGFPVTMSPGCRWTFAVCWDG